MMHCTWFGTEMLRGGDLLASQHHRFRAGARCNSKSRTDKLMSNAIRRRNGAAERMLDREARRDRKA
jgi:hypothetical protein